MEASDDTSSSSQVQVTIKRPIGVIHFSDGIEEIMEEEKVNELETHPGTEQNVDTKSLSWGPWLSYYTWKSGSKLLNAVDYAGESLASFFGITTPKYQIEMNEYERIQEERKKLEEDAVGWVPNNVGGDIPLVTNEPLKLADRTNHV